MTRKISKVLRVRPITLIVFMWSNSLFAATIIHDTDSVKFYAGGYAALDMLTDTTQGIEEIVGSTPVGRPGTVAGDKGRTIFSSRTSRC